MFPLISELRSSLDYLLLAEGLHQGLVCVREISAGGSVPDLVVENRADVAVLIVDGDALTMIVDGSHRSPRGDGGPPSPSSGTQLESYAE